MTSLAGDVGRGLFRERPFLLQSGVVNEKMDRGLDRRVELLFEMDFVKSRPDVVKELEDSSRTISKFSKLNCFLPTIVIPSNEILKKIAADYKEKYGIEIIVCTLEEFREGIDSFCALAIKLIGVIVVQNSGYGHVLPLILNFQNGAKQIFSLNTGSNRGLEKELVSFLRGLEFEVFLTLEDRQYDYYSCRTEATVILRNALLDMRERGLEGFDAFLIRDVRQDSAFFVPKEWTYGAQIVRATDDLDQVDVIRHKYSKKSEKRDGFETAREYRERHTEEIVIKTVYEWVFLFLREKNEEHEVSIVTDVRKRSYAVKNSIPEDGLDDSKDLPCLKIEIQDIVKKTTNLFLVLKGYKNAIKYGIKLDVPEILRGYFSL
jgi:hypothetical protein